VVIAGQHLGYGRYLKQLRALSARGEPGSGGGAAGTAWRGGGGTAVPGSAPGGRSRGRVHPGNGDHGGAVGDRGPPGAAACSRTSGVLASRLTGEVDGELAGVLLRLQFFALYHLIQLGESASQAVAVGQQLTADLERTLGRDHPDTLNSRNSLAAAYQLAGQPAAAIPLFEATLVAREEVLGLVHPSALTSRASLATAYRDAGRSAC
jgi:hypothetical protein